MDICSRENYKKNTEMQDNLLPRCILCNKVPAKGIKDGFLLMGQFICSSCEEVILSLSYNDPTYNEMVQQLKQTIYKNKRSYK